MSDSAVLTTAMSSMSIAVAAHTTARVQRWVVVTGVSPGGSKGEGRTACSRPAAASTSGESLVRVVRLPLLRGPHVAGGAEDVLGVPAGLHAREAVVVGAVRRAHALRALLAGEVQVDAARAVRRDGLAGGAAVGDQALVVGRVLPQHQRVDDEAGVAARQRR